MDIDDHTAAPSPRLRPPLRSETFDPYMRQVVFWHLLMTEADEFSARTGLGIASLWGEIRRGHYHAARAHMDRLLAPEAAAR